MPRGDGTGPMGLGPGTGWDAGFCTGNNLKARGYFCWGGNGRGWRNVYRATGLPGWVRAEITPYANSLPFDKNAEKTHLENFSKALEQQLQNIKSRLSQLEKES